MLTYSRCHRSRLVGQNTFAYFSRWLQVATLLDTTIILIVLWKKIDFNLVNWPSILPKPLMPIRKGLFLSTTKCKMPGAK